MNEKRTRAAVVGGYALLLVFFGLFAGRVNPLFFGENIAVTFPLYAHAAEIGQVCCLFLAALLAVRHPRLAERIAPHAALALLVAGYALTLYQAVGNGRPPFLASVAGALFGCGQGACFLCWFLVYARMEPSRVARAMVASTLLSGVIILAIGLIPDTVMLFSALSLIVAGCSGLMYYCLSVVKTSVDEPARPAPSPNDGEPVRSALVFDGDGLRTPPNLASGDPSADPASGGRTSPYAAPSSGGAAYAPSGRSGSPAQEGRRFLSWIFMERRSLLCLVAIAFVCGAQRVISLEGFLPDEAIRSLFSVGYLGGALAFWATGKAEGGTGSSYRTYSILLVVMATCGVFSSFQNVQVQTVLYAIDNVAFTIVSMCVILTALKAVREFWRNPLFVGGIVCGIMYFSIQFGRMVCMAVAEFIGMDAIGILIVSVIILYVVALAAISSGLFFRQAAKSAGMMGSAETVEGEGPADPLRRVVISVANVTEDELRENPVYRQQYKLTDREIDVAVLLLAGYNSTDIAKILTISVNTVKTHLKNLYAKMAVHNRRELIEALNEIERER